ncbi:MAG: SUF system NifU family Fe-S cluster assembly protein [Planctomycetes bacterium]|nr:SUF system NifU family Fe-S cluster assembly protein [Planctomycetota bacterium]
MSELEDLYQEMILGHAKAPRNFGRLEPCNAQAQGYNPLCGDRIGVSLLLSDGRIADVRFDGAGCAICTASASLMTESVKGRTRPEIDAVFHRVHDLVTGKGNRDDPLLGKLAVFGGVSEFPMRVKCATLPWHTLNAAFDQSSTPVSTE